MHFSHLEIITQNILKGAVCSFECQAPIDSHNKYFLWQNQNMMLVFFYCLGF